MLHGASIRARNGARDGEARRLGAMRRRNLARSLLLLAACGLAPALPVSSSLATPRASLAFSGASLFISGARAEVEGDVEPEKPHVDPAEVYYGDAAHWKKPAEVDADAVYAEIPEYKRIVADGLEPDDPKYQLLMNRASKRFVAAVRKAARDGKHDLVARRGSVRGVKDVPDLTAAVIERL